MSLAKVSRLLAAFIAGLTLTMASHAQVVFNKPIRILVGFSAGGTTDSVARLYAQKLTGILNTPVVVENRPGALQVVAIRTLLAAPPDGYTLYAGSGSSLVQNPALVKSTPFDPLKDFSLVGLVSTSPGVIVVSNDLPIHTFAELVTYAKANPGKLNYGTAGIGSTGHLAIQAMQSATGISMTHIPHKTDSDTIRELIAGRVHLGPMPTLNAVRAIKAGQMRAILATTTNRLPYLPNVPGISEAGADLSALDPYTLAGFVGPAGMPPEVVARLNDAINQVSRMPDVITVMREQLYSEPMITTPASFRTFLEKQIAVWREIGRKSNLVLP